MADIGMKAKFENCDVKMARFFSDMKTRATPHNLTELERLRPIGPNNEKLIAGAFKPEYVRQIQTWALTNSSGSRRKLFAFLNAESHATEKPVMEVSRADFILTGTQGRVDFNGAIFGEKRVPKKINPRKFDSTGVSEVFGCQSLPRLDLSQTAKKSSTLAEFLIRKLMTPMWVNKVINVATQYSELLRELNDWVDKRTNLYPIDTNFSHPTLSPRSARLMTAKSLSEDHLSSGRYKPAPPTARYTQRTSTFLRTGRSEANEAFSIESRCGAEHKMSHLIKPLEMGQSFASFPSPLEQPAPPESGFIRMQSIMNTRAGKAYRSVFEAQTCL